MAFPEIIIKKCDSCVFGFNSKPAGNGYEFFPGCALNKTIGILEKNGRCCFWRNKNLFPANLISALINIFPAEIVKKVLKPLILKTKKY